MQAEPLGGGQLLGAGRLWVSPAAELDPRAVRVHMEGRGLPAEAIITRYLPKVQAARRSLTCTCSPLPQELSSCYAARELSWELDGHRHLGVM